MSRFYPDHETKRIVRSKLSKLLGESGLIEYSCRSLKCRSQVFTTWEVDLTCNQCGQPLRLPVI